MKIFVIGLVLLFSISVVPTVPAGENEFKAREAQVAQYKKWLDTLGPHGSRFWVRLDGRRRPHRLYLGEPFFKADPRTQEQFIDTFSNYLAGHPEKYMLIDLFDSTTNKAVGEYGFGGFKMFRPSSRVIESARK